MKPDRTALDKALYRHLSLFGSPSTALLETSRGRIRGRLRAGYESDDSDEPVRASEARSPWRLALPLVTAAAVIALVVIAPWQRDLLATVEYADGSRGAVAANAVLRARDTAGTMLTLHDGSRIEMRARSELSLEHATDGIGIRLGAGGVIVNAAKQRDGHLYVHTKDMTIAVVGTMFVVNAEESGSRVTVLDGEVRVREGTTEKSLRRGDQVSTNPAFVKRPVKEEIAWSRHADAILAAFVRGMSDTAAPLSPSIGANQSPVAGGQTQSPGFEAASIRQCDPGNLPQTPEGARGGGANSFRMTPGRLNALCMTVATLIRVAYGYSPLELDFGGDRDIPADFNVVYGAGEENGRRVRGGGDWVRSERYTIEAVAAASGALPNAAALRGAMLQRLLESRFQLKAHIESEQVPAFALTLAKGGLKIKPVTSGACEPLPGRAGAPLVYGFPASVLTPPRRFDVVSRGEKPSCGMWGHRYGPNWVFLGGEVPIEALTSLGFRLGGVRIFDRTNVTGRFNIVLEFANDENTPGLPGGDLPARGAEPIDVPRAATIFTALEEQLGLRLERAQAPREFIVIDHVARPSPN